MAILESFLVLEISLSLSQLSCVHIINTIIIEDRIIYLESKQSFLTSQDNKGMVFE